MLLRNYVAVPRTSSAYITTSSPPGLTCTTARKEIARSDATIFAEKAVRTIPLPAQAVRHTPVTRSPLVVETDDGVVVRVVEVDANAVVVVVELSAAGRHSRVVALDTELRVVDLVLVWLLVPITSDNKLGSCSAICVVAGSAVKGKHPWSWSVAVTLLRPPST